MQPKLVIMNLLCMYMHIQKNNLFTSFIAVVLSKNNGRKHLTIRK